MTLILTTASMILTDRQVNFLSLKMSSSVLDLQRSPSIFVSSRLTGVVLWISATAPAFASFAYLINLVRRDYQAFLGLGPGGLPSNPYGYAWTCFLRTVSLRNVLQAPVIPSTLQPQCGILTDLPPRRGPPPLVEGIAPQRQVTQKSCEAMFQRLSASMRHMVERHSDRLYLATSSFEHHSPGVHAHPNHRLHDTKNGEIVHAHPSDGSMHLSLHPADCRLVLERGWGQRHPIAWDRGLWKDRYVPAGFTMVFAPRDEKELEVVLQIIHAAAWYVLGVRVDPVSGEVGAATK